MEASAEQAVGATRLWLERAVIGLELCPFARAAHAREQVRFRVSAAETQEDLLHDLAGAALALRDEDPERVETLLLIHPGVLGDFLEYNDFLDLAEGLLAELGLEDVFQLASFHPDYRFAGAEPDAIENCTNRSPYPILQLLRVDSVARAVAALADPAEIYERNIVTLRSLGRDGWDRLGLAPPGSNGAAKRTVR